MALRSPALLFLFYYWGSEFFSRFDFLSIFAISYIANIKIMGLSGSCYSDGKDTTVTSVQKEDIMKFGEKRTVIISTRSQNASLQIQD
jgi:D-hexose-6-phosphate mutarotase